MWRLSKKEHFTEDKDKRNTEKKIPTGVADLGLSSVSPLTGCLGYR